jgi:formylmethanofuran dehydrogenase subunit C
MLRLRYKSDTRIPIEAESATPDNLCNKTTREVARTPAQHGNVQVALGEVFDVSGTAADGVVRIEGDCSRVKLLGAGMASGHLVIDGNAGMRVGAEMSGGLLEVHGSAGEWAGAQMRGGRLHVYGDAGDLVGAAYRGGPIGMRGGTILVHGSAGDEIGGAMRRGLIVIGKKTGAFCGASMIAGTIFVFGEGGARPAAGMKRGTLAFFGGMPELLPTFRYDCLLKPPFLEIYLRQLRAWGFPVRDGHFEGTYARYSGDLVSLGLGELLVWRAAP